MNIVGCPGAYGLIQKGSSKKQNGLFASEIALRLKKVYYKVSLCKCYQPHSCKAFTALSIRAKWFAGDVP